MAAKIESIEGQPADAATGSAYCRGGAGVRDDGGTGRTGATDGCAGGSGIFAISSATAASNRAISRLIWS
jgi:hypothetical protein